MIAYNLDEKQRICSLDGTRRYKCLFGLLLIAMSCIQGCATVTQSQYFAVVEPPDPKTGEIRQNYYRMTVEGRGNILNKYKLSAAYVSKAAIETLRGEEPTIPVIDTPDQNQETFDEIKKHLLAAFEAQASEHSAAASGFQSAEEQEEHVLAMARQLWMSSLSDSDLISMGQVEDSDPYEFRKLVLYATAKNIKFEQVASDIDSVISDMEVIAQNEKKKRKAAEQAREQRRQAIIGGIPNLRTWANTLPDSQKIPILNFIGVVEAFNGSKGGDSNGN